MENMQASVYWKAAWLESALFCLTIVCSGAAAEVFVLGLQSWCLAVFYLALEIFFFHQFKCMCFRHDCDVAVFFFVGPPFNVHVFIHSKDRLLKKIKENCFLFCSIGFVVVTHTCSVLVQPGDWVHINWTVLKSIFESAGQPLREFLLDKFVNLHTAKKFLFLRFPNKYFLDPHQVFPHPTQPANAFGS